MNPGRMLPKSPGNKKVLIEFIGSSNLSHLRNLTPRANTNPAASPNNPASHAWQLADEEIKTMPAMKPWYIATKCEPSSQSNTVKSFNDIKLAAEPAIQVFANPPAAKYFCPALRSLFKVNTP